MASRPSPDSRHLLNKHFTLLLNGVCSWGMIPIYWHRETGSAKLISSKRLICKWLATLAVVTIGCVGLLLNVVLTIVREGFQTRNMYFMFNFLLSLTSSLSLFFVYHTAFKRHQLLALLNEVTHFWIGFSGNIHGQSDEVLRKNQTAERMFSIIINFTHYGLLSAGVFAVPSYFAKCGMHMIAPLLPVCLNYGTDPYVWVFRNPLYFVLMNMCQYFWLLLHTSSVAVMVAVISANTLFSQAALAHLTHKAEEGRMSREEVAYCVKVYRSLQILAQDQDRCFAHDMWPALIAIFSTVSLISLPLAIRMTDPIIKASNPATFIVFTTMLWGFLDFGSRLLESAKHFARESQRTASLPYQKRLFYSFEHCASFKVRIGPFGYLRKAVVAGVLGILFENIGTLLILTKQ